MKLRENKIKNLSFVKGKAVNFKIDNVRLPNKKTALREYLDHPGAVAVIPRLDKNTILLVRQYRYPVRSVTWEVPAGKLDGRESPVRCAKRELSEETGYRAGRMKKILSFWPTPAFSNEIIHVYEAKDLVKGRKNLDDDEFVECEAWPLKKALKAVREGRIKDSKTVIALLACR